MQTSSNTFFIGCTHFQHKNICKGTSQWPSGGMRDFATTEEMDDAIINSINRKVGSDDTLYMLGDIIFGQKSNIVDLRQRINCQKIHFIYGNHDYWLRKKKDYHYLFKSLSDYRELYICKRLLVLSHYPILSWTEMHSGSYMIHSHTHGTIEREQERFGKIIDVGWDAVKEPLSYEEIHERLSNVSPVWCDHHRS